jgi:hypothetical protein
MLFVYLTVAFMKIPNPVAGSGVLAAAVFATIDALLCVFVLLKGKKIAENMAGQLGTVVSGFAGKLAVAGVGLATGGTGLLASSTLGAAGGILARSGTLKRLEDAGPSQKQEDVQQRMKTASTFRKFGMGRLATSIEKGNFSTSGMLSSAARNVRSIGKSTVTTNPLDAKIIGTSVRGLTGKIATAAEGGKKPLLGTDGKPVLGKDGKPIMVGGILEQSLDKDLAKQTQKGAIMNRALDIAATKNKQNTITNNQTNAVNAGLNSNPLGSQPGTGTPAGSTPQTSPTNPPTNPPTGGVTTPNKNIPPVGVTVPNAPNQITPQTSSNLTQVQRLPDRVIKPSPLKPENLVISAENITINQPAKSATVDRPPAPVTIVDRFNKPITREPIIAPTTPSGSHAKNYLSGIQSIIPPITNKMAPVIDTLKNINNDQQKITGVSDKQQV